MLRARPLLALLAAALLAGPGRPAAGAGAERGGARADARRAAEAELAELAPRIESLKREVAAGRSAGELERLLTRAQELAALLERLGRAGAPLPARTDAPDAQELRERADALRDRADRLAAVLPALERRLAEASRRAELERRLEAAGGHGDLFAESSPRRRSGGAAAARDAVPTPVNAGPAGSGQPGAGTASGGAGGALVALPELPGPELLSPAPGDSPVVLRRKRAELAARVAALTAEAAALDAQARTAETGR